MASRKAGTISRGSSLLMQNLKNFRNFCKHQGKLIPGPEAVRAEGGVAMSGKKNSGNPMEKAMDLTIWQSAKTDPQGSYTGTPADPYEVPVQDADDL